MGANEDEAALNSRQFAFQRHSRKVAAFLTDIVIKQPRDKRSA
jgi:hypothetical protein